MAWIESHQSLQRHPKTVVAAALLKINRHSFLGHLHCLWWWALDVADIDGNLPENVNDLVLAGAAEWTLKKSESWREALITAGFLEQVGPIYRLHDWYEYAGKLNAKRAANKERMRDARAEHVQRTNDARAAHVQGLPTRPTGPTGPTEPEEPAEPLLSNDNKKAGQCSGLALYEQRIRPAHSSSLIQEITDAEDEFGFEWLLAAFDEAEVQNKVKWSYIRGILKRWAAEGKGASNGRKEEPEWTTEEMQEWADRVVAEETAST